MAKLYDIRPSELIPDLDEYTAFCFDEACSYIMVKLQEEDAQEPKFKKDTEGNILQAPQYHKASDLYKSMGYTNGAYTKTKG